MQLTQPSKDQNTIWTRPDFESLIFKQLHKWKLSHNVIVDAIIPVLFQMFVIICDYPLKLMLGHARFVDW